MQFLIAFDLPIRNNPEREFERKDLAAGRLHAKRMELTLRMHLEWKAPITFFLYVHDGKDWVPHYKIDDDTDRKEIPATESTEAPAQ